MTCKFCRNDRWFYESTTWGGVRKVRCPRCSRRGDSPASLRSTARAREQLRRLRDSHIG